MARASTSSPSSAAGDPQHRRHAIDAGVAGQPRPEMEGEAAPGGVREGIRGSRPSGTGRRPTPGRRSPASSSARAAAPRPRCRPRRCGSWRGVGELVEVVAEQLYRLVQGRGHRHHRRGQVPAVGGVHREPLALARHRDHLDAGLEGDARHRRGRLAHGLQPSLEPVAARILLATGAALEERSRTDRREPVRLLRRHRLEEGRQQPVVVPAARPGRSSRSRRSGPPWSGTGPAWRRGPPRASRGPTGRATA